ncbi:receptor expression-enhancing protein 6-like [Ornithodoros turicata]|uniref:receptor expression-enhancing protein 6-like n=1 Tax=Ornithodoros turicata TaxID=34597 RepID=UPI003138ADED
MAQEFSDELGKVLKERGVIGDALDNIENKTKVKREHIVYGLMGFVFVLFICNFLGAKAATCITTIWPMLGSVRAVDRADTSALQKWTAYWIVYALVNVFFNFIFIGMYRYFKRIFLIKLLFLAWCAAPVKGNGAQIIFQKALAGKIFREGGGGGGGSVAPPAPAAPAAGGKKDSPDNSRKMKK